MGFQNETSSRVVTWMVVFASDTREKGRVSSHAWWMLTLELSFLHQYRKKSIHLGDRWRFVESLQAPTDFSMASTI